MSKPRKYAHGTKVAVESTQVEIRRFLQTRGAESFGQAYMEGKGSQVVCKLHGRMLRFDVPHSDDEAEERRLWRVLLMRVKLRWEEFANAEVPFDEAFLSFIVAPDNKLMRDHLVPTIEHAYASGKVGPLRLEW